MIYDDTNLRPPRCQGGGSTFTVTIDVDAASATSGSNVLVLGPSPVSNSIHAFAEALRRARALAAEQNELALSSARIALRRLRGDPGYRVPPPEQSTARRRRQFAGRVCGGSSRYRVMVG